MKDDKADRRRRLENHLNSEFNIRIHEDFENGRSTHFKYTSLEFLDLLYSEYAFCIKNKQRKLTVLAHLNKINIDEEVKLELYDLLSKLIAQANSGKPDKQMELLGKLINREFRTNLNRLFPEYWDRPRPFMPTINWNSPDLTSNSTKQAKKPEYRLSQVALLYFYKRKPIKKGKEADNIAKEHGHNSGHKLYQKFNYYSSTSNRTGRAHPFTLQTMRNKISLFESIVPLLTKKEQLEIADDLKKLKILSKELE